jgi:hypothetical protein
MVFLLHPGFVQCVFPGRKEVIREVVIGRPPARHSYLINQITMCRTAKLGQTKAFGDGGGRANDLPDAGREAGQTRYPRDGAARRQIFVDLTE